MISRVRAAIALSITAIVLLISGPGSAQAATDVLVQVRAASAAESVANLPSAQAARGQELAARAAATAAAHAPQVSIPKAAAKKKPTPPASVTGLGIEAPSPNVTKLTWKNPASGAAGVPDATNVVICREQVATPRQSCVPIAKLAANAVTYTDTGLTTGTSYRYQAFRTAGTLSSTAATVEVTPRKQATKSPAVTLTPTSGTCSIYWTGRASSDWGTTSNWSSTDGGQTAARLPAKSDYVCMSSSPVRAAVVLVTNTPFTIAGLNWPKTSTVSPSLQIGDVPNGYSGSITIGTSSAAYTTQVATLKLVYGTVSSGLPITVGSMAVQPYGTLSGSGTFTVSSGGTLAVTGGSLGSNTKLVNKGTATFGQSTTLNMGTGAILENAGALSLSDGAVITNSNYYTPRFVNDAGATLKFAGSAASSRASVGVPFDNLGAVVVTKGSMSFQAGSSGAYSGDTGSYSAAANSVITFSGGTRTLTASVTFPGNGQIEVSSTYLQLGQGVSLSLSNLLLDGGSINGHGTLTIPSGGVADLAGGTLAGGLKYINNGTTTQAATSSLALYDASVLTNNATMTFADASYINQSCCNYYYYTPGWLVNSSGATMTYTASASSAQSEIDYAALDNYGTIHVVRGTLRLHGGTSSESSGDTGTFVTESAGALDLSGTRTETNATSFSGAGQVTLSGTVTVNRGTTLGFPNLLLQATLTGEGGVQVASGSTAVLNGVSLWNGATLVNRGATTIATSTSVCFSGGGTLDNYGTFVMSDSASVGVSSTSNCNDGGFVNRSGGSITYAGSATNSQTNIYAPFDNFGTVTVSRGTLTLSGGSTDSSSGDTGTYNVAPSAYLVSSEYKRSLAASVKFPGAGQFTVSGGAEFGGSMTLPSLAYSGTVELDPGVTLTATVVGQPSGTLQLDADRPGRFGRLVAKAGTDLSGLSLSLVSSGFAIPCGSSTVALTAPSLSNTFYQVSASVLPNNGSVAASYSSTQAKAVISCYVPSVSNSRTNGTGSGADGPNPSGYRGEPVNTATGAYATEQIDAQVAGLGQHFSFVRYYNSNNTGSVGVLGTGWTSSYSQSLYASGSSVYVTAEDGSVADFSQNTDGSWAAGVGITSKLTTSGTNWVLTRKDGSKLTFNSVGQLTSQTDQNGMGVSLTYNSDNRVASVKDHAGRTMTFTYNANGQLTAISLPLSRSLKFAYNAANLLASVTDAAGAVTTYGYNGDGRLITVKDPLGRVTVTNTYDSSARVVKQVDAAGKASSYKYDDSSGTTTYVDPNGKSWKDSYGSYTTFALLSRTDPLGNVTSYSYDQNLNRTSVTLPGGQQYLMSYDDAGNLIDRTSPLGYEERWAYSANDKVLEYTDAKGQITKYSYDSRGNLTKATAPDGAASTFSYDATTGAMLTTKTPAGVTTSFTYDAAGNVTKQTDAAGGATTWTYDGAGRPVSKVSPRGNVAGASAATFTTAYTYDADDRLLTQKDPLGSTTTYAYDKVGDLTSLKDAAGSATTYGYDSLNRLVSTTAADGSVTKRGYDAASNLTSVTSGNGNVTSYGYDAAGRRVAETTPLGHKTTFAYDVNGNLTKNVDAIGNAAASGGVTTYGYDANARLTSTSYSDGTHAVTYGYDANSNLAKMTDGAGTSTFTYNSRDALTKSVTPQGSFAYSYNADAQPTSRTYPDGTAVTATYASTGDLASVTSAGKTVGYSYDADRNLVATTLPSAAGIVEKRTYDANDRLSSVVSMKGSATVLSYTVTRDSLGNPTSVASPTSPSSYTYDAMNRITSACYGTSCAQGKTSYSYDADGNIATRASGATNPVTTTFAYDGDDQVTSSTTGSSAPVTYKYDLDGRRTADGANTYSYNLADELTSAKVNSVTATYGYDGFGNRVSATVGSTTSKYAWDVNNQLPLLAADTAGTTTQDYVWGQSAVGFKNASGSFFTLHDGQDSAVGIVSADGTLQSRAAFGALGAKYSSTTIVSGSPNQSVGWQGQTYDATGLYDFRARVFSPVSGTFLSRDPLTQSPLLPGVSPYAYANNHPTTDSDPSGMMSLIAMMMGGASWDNVASAANSANLASLDSAAPGTSCAVMSYIRGGQRAERFSAAGAEFTVSTFPGADLLPEQAPINGYRTIRAGWQMYETAQEVQSGVAANNALYN